MEKVEIMLSGEEPEEYFHLVMDSEEYLTYSDPDIYGKKEEEMY